MNIPNIISLARLLCVPLIIWMVLEGYYLFSFLSFVLAGISDALDGIIARLLKARTPLGSYLDPLADKALLTSLFIVLGHKGFIPIWLVISVVSRDIMIVGGACLLFILGNPFTLKPITISKVNTCFQVLLIAIILAHQGLQVNIVENMTWLFYSTEIVTLLSGAGYLKIWLTNMNVSRV